jgi:hypothetical protein
MVARKGRGRYYTDEVAVTQHQLAAEERKV